MQAKNNLCDCFAYGDEHSSCLKARFGELDASSPACKDIKYIRTCGDCSAYGDTHSSCFKVREHKVTGKGKSWVIQRGLCVCVPSTLAH